MLNRHTIISAGSILILSLFVSTMLAFDPYVKVQKGKSKADNAVEKVERKILLKDAELRYITNTPSGQNESLHRKWGDFFFGLTFGRPPHSNGSWNSWNFLQIYLKPNDNSKQIQLEHYLPKEFFAYKQKGTNYAEIIWDIPGSSSTATLKIAQFPSHKKWLFFKLSCTKPYSISQFNINCYPGNSNWTKLRQRLVTCRNSSTNLDKQAATLHLTSPGLLYHNKFDRENDANFAIVDCPKIKTITIPKTTNNIRTKFSLKPDSTSITFALGYMINSKSPEYDFRMFLDEKQDRIYNFMKTINWHTIPSQNEFNNLIEDINELLASPLLENNEKLKDFEDEKNELQNTYTQAKKNNDSSAAHKTIKKAKKLKEKIISTGFNKLK